jgi:ribosomal RNA assembly protein
MKKILSPKIARVIRNKKKLEKELGLKITNRGKEVTIEGSSENEYFGEKVIDALNFGFPISFALSIKKEDKDFEIISIKEHTKRQDLERIRGRIIGKGGKGLRTLSNLTNCYLEIKDNEVGIIGDPENIKTATEAIIYMVKGSKHGNVYSFLEKNKVKPIEDLGLKK